MYNQQTMVASTWKRYLHVADTIADFGMARDIYRRDIHRSDYYIKLYIKVINICI